MAQSFTPATPLAEIAKTRRRVLVTGAAGNIGSYFAEHSHEKYDLRLMVLKRDEDSRRIERFGEIVEGNLDDLPRLKELCAGVNTVLHLAASAGPSSVWETEVLPNNIIGLYNTFVAAKAAGCRRVVFASSIHAVSGYPRDVQVKTTDPVNPGDLYGVSKCFGEAMARYMAEQEKLSSICLRIGAFQPLQAARQADSLEMMDAWVSQRDLNQLINRCIDAENIRFAIFNGLSRNRFNRLDISDARDLLGYAPQDDMTEVQPHLKKLKLSRKVKSHSQRDGEKSGLRKTLAKLRGTPRSPSSKRTRDRT